MEEMMIDHNFRKYMKIHKMEETYSNIQVFN